MVNSSGSGGRVGTAPGSRNQPVCEIDSQTQRFFPGSTQHHEVNMKQASSVLSASETEQVVLKNLPVIDHHDEIVEDVGNDSIRRSAPLSRRSSWELSLGRTTAASCSPARW